MAKKSAKAQTVVPLDLTLSGGLNYAKSISAIGDNDLSRGNNYLYKVDTGQLIVRPGTDCLTASAAAAAILKGYYYEKDSTTKYIVLVANGKLYYFKADDGTLVEIGSLNDNTTTPCFLTFHSKLLIADGGDDIKTWDGTTFTTIANSPKATILKEVGNRVWCNATDEPDSVYGCGPEDETDWNTSTGGAVGIKCGYGDMLSVNAMAVGPGGKDLLVSKKGDQDKKIYRIDLTDPTPANWEALPVSMKNAAQNPHCMETAFNNVYFIDTNGFKSLKGVQEYGDIQADMGINQVNTIFSASYTTDELAYIPAYNSLWFQIQNRTFVYHPLNNAFTDLTFQWGRVRCVFQAGDTVYLCGNNGHLYKFDETLDTDETVPGTTQSYVSTLKTKLFSSGHDVLLKRLQWQLIPKSAGVGQMYIANAAGTEYLVKTITLTEEGDYIFDATGYIDAATEYIYDSGSLPWAETSWQRVRSSGVAFILKTTSGRVGIEWVKAEIAVVGV